MAEFTEDIIINVGARYEQVNGLQNKLNELKEQLKSLGKGRVDFGLKKMIKNASDPIIEATKQLEIAQKNLEKTQNKIRVERITTGGVDNSLLDSEKDAKIRLASVIKTIEHTKEIAQIEAEITQQKQKQEEYTKKLVSAQDALQKVMLALDPAKRKMAELQSKMSDVQQEFIKLNMEGKDTGSVENSIKKVYKQMQKLEESTKKTSSRLTVLWGRIKNIAIYRMIRSSIKSIIGSFKEGLNNFVQYSDSANKTVSNLNASLKQIKNTLGVALGQTLIALEPIITKVTNLLVDVVNAFNLAMAKMQGKNVYTKAKKNVEDYAKSLQKVQKLSFDSFEALSGDSGTNIAEMFEEADVNEDANELSGTFEKILKILKNIWKIVSKIISIIEESGLIQGILSIVEPILEVVNIILTVVKPLLQNIFDFIGSIIQQVSGMFKIIGGLLKLLTGDFKGFWNDIKQGFAKLFDGILNMFITILNGIIDGINFLVTVAGGWIFQLFGINTKIPHIPKSHLAGYEQGGIPAKSELFYMNENGRPEALVNTGGSETNVINIDQLTEGMRRGFVQAIYDTGLLNAMQQGSSTIVVDKDVLGRTVAESAGFRNEVNRRNSSLNLR